MRIDPQVVQEAQRRAFNTITTPMRQTIYIDADGKKQEGDPEPNKFYVDPYKVTSPVELVQEQAITATKQVYDFDFTWNAPKPAATLNNVVLPKNNIAAIYAIRFLIGVGDTAVARTYRSSGFTPADDSVYNSQVSMKIETDDAIGMLNGLGFKNTYPTPNEFDDLSGMQIINPIRILTGEMGVFKLSLSLLNPNSALIYTPSLWLSARLVCVMGQASAQAKR